VALLYASRIAVSDALGEEVQNRVTAKGRHVARLLVRLVMNTGQDSARRIALTPLFTDGAIGNEQLRSAWCGLHARSKDAGRA
jgi:hypothetical protein